VTQDVYAEDEDSGELPIVETKDVLNSLGHPVISSADEEAIAFLLASARAKIWKHTFQDEQSAVEQANRFQGEGYGDRVRTEFLDEYHRAKSLEIPAGYAFQKDGKLATPNLMQRLIAVQVRDQKRVGNWSGTGAGKTLSAVLASCVVDANLTLVCCPNSVVNGWKEAIFEIFPHSQVATKTFNPTWSRSTKPRYLVLNYEMFQQDDSALKLRSLLERETIDLIVIDEIHYTKQRHAENMSRRKELVSALVSAAEDRNPDVRVLGMSATPVINNLQEGKSLVELVTGIEHDDLATRPTVPNCMKLHQKLVTLGIRWMPDYKAQLGEPLECPIEIDCGDFLPDIRALVDGGSPLALEQILTQARLSVIREQIQPKTLIYTYYVREIDQILTDALTQDGWTVGCYTGDDKSGLQKFLQGDLDILIGSSAISTGVDKLQYVCSRLILNVLPWTHAEYEQLLGRIYRQGQKNPVTVVFPLTYAMVNGDRWSWCESKMQRLKFKKSIADAAVDGVVPEGHLRSEAQAYQDVMAWLKRLENGEIQTIQRRKLFIPLPPPDDSEASQNRLRRYGEFSQINQRWNTSNSQTTHQKLQENPEEWQHYHSLYREARKTWAIVPYEEIIRWCEKRTGLVVGDFGCGEAKLAEALSDRHTIHSFDHIAINGNVISCDIAHVPLDDESLDVAVFSLSLMGANFTDYLREAHRTLKLDGHLHIMEATSRFKDLEQFKALLHGLGFDMVTSEDKDKFTHIRAMKSDRMPQSDLKLKF
jgi:superfamily II DNA or RNA helicase